MILQVAVESPASGCVRADQITHPLGRLDDERVLVGRELTVAIFQLTPKSVQMNRVLHHRVVDENEAHTLAEFQMDWLKLHAKAAVIDKQALLSSANLTDDAFLRNLELVFCLWAAICLPSCGNILSI